MTHNTVEHPPLYTESTFGFILCQAQTNQKRAYLVIINIHSPFTLTASQPIISLYVICCVSFVLVAYQGGHTHSFFFFFLSFFVCVVVEGRVRWNNTRFFFCFFLPVCQSVKKVLLSRARPTLTLVLLHCSGKNVGKGRGWRQGGAAPSGQAAAEAAAADPAGRRLHSNGDCCGAEILA